MTYYARAKMPLAVQLTIDRTIAACHSPAFLTFPVCLRCPVRIKSSLNDPSSKSAADMKCHIFCRSCNSVVQSSVNLLYSFFWLICHLTFEIKHILPDYLWNCPHLTTFDCLLSVSLIMQNQRGHNSSADRRNRKGQFPAGHPLLPPLPEGHASAMCPSSLSGGVHFWVLASSIWGTPVSLTSRVTFSPRQVSCSVTSGWRLSVKMWSCLCRSAPLMVLPKEHRFGVKQDLMWDDRGDRDKAGLAVFYEVALARQEASY